jgi:hypothetical protein
MTTPFLSVLHCRLHETPFQPSLTPTAFEYLHIDINGGFSGNGFAVEVEYKQIDADKAFVFPPALRRPVILGQCPLRLAITCLNISK